MLKWRRSINNNWVFSWIIESVVDIFLSFVVKYQQINLRFKIIVTNETDRRIKILIWFDFSSENEISIDLLQTAADIYILIKLEIFDKYIYIQ